jgi:hypothetical protein
VSAVVGGGGRGRLRVHACGDCNRAGANCNS